MSFFTSVEHVFVVFEADVVAVVVKIKQAEEVASREIGLVLNWIANNVGTIAQDLQLVESVAVAVAPTPQVLAAVATANEAMAALNTYAQAHALGQSTAQAAINGYTAFKQAQAAASTAVAAATSSSPSTPVLALAILS
jgi:hypothetical protein